VELSLEKIKKVIILAGIVCFFFFLFHPGIEGVTRAGKVSLGIFFLAGSLWITNAIPLAITGLFVIGLIPLLGVLPPKETFSLFGNGSIFFILGAFILSAGLIKSGLARRVALLLIGKFSGSYKQLLIGVLVTSCLLAFFMPEHAVAAMLFPVTLDISHYLKIDERRKVGAWLFLLLAWGSVIGGVATPLGGARAPLAIGLLLEEYGMRVDFLKWSLMCVPIALSILLVAISRVLTLNPKGVEITHISEKARDELVRIGKLSSLEKKTSFVFFLAFICWVFLNRYIDMATVAILAAALLFFLRVLSWKDIENYVNWGVILMYGGAIVLGATLVKTGAAKWIAISFLRPFLRTPFSVFVTFSLISVLVTEFLSNVATVALLLPIAFGVANVLGIDPFFITLTVTVPSGLAFCLPIGTPPNAIAFSSGRYGIGFSMKNGVLMNISSWLIILFFGIFYWPHFGGR